MTIRIDELRAEVRHHRARLGLYRARLYGLRRSSTSRLHELELALAAAESRLRDAERGEASRERAADVRAPGARDAAD